MTILLDSSHQASPILKSFYIPFINHDNTDSLVIVRAFQVDVYDLNHSKLTTTKSHSLNILERIVGCNSIKPKGQQSDWLLLLTELNKLYLVGFNQSENDFRLLTVMNFKDTINQFRPSLDLENQLIAPISVSCPSVEVDFSQRYIIVYSCEGFLTILELHPDKSKVFQQAMFNDPPEQVKKRKQAIKLSVNRLFEQPVVVSIGSNPVHSITFLKYSRISKLKGGAMFALVSRDSSLRYGLAYFTISNFKTAQVEITKKFPLMDDTPDIVIPLPRGDILVICDSTHYLYPSPSIKLLTSSLQNITVSRNYCYKTLKSENEGRFAKFISYCRVSNDKYILCSSNGTYFSLQIALFSEGAEHEELNLDASISGRLRNEERTKSTTVELSVDAWEVSAFGESMLASTLLKIGDGIYYGSNGYSQAGLFTNAHFSNPKWLFEKCYKPITAMAKLDDDLAYCSGNSQGSTFYYGDKAFDVGGVIKKFSVMNHIKIGLCFVLLIEHQFINLEKNCIEQVHRLEIVNNHFESQSVYEFLPGASVFDLISAVGLKYYFDDKLSLTDENINELNRRLETTFLVVGDSLDKEVDIISNDTTEFTLFSIDGNGALNIDNIATVNSNISLLLKLNERSILLLGSRCLFWTSLSVYKSEEGLKFKLDLMDSYLQLPIAYPSSAILLSKTNILISDAFDGLYHLKLDLIRNKVLKATRLLEKAIITDMTDFGNDGLIVGDILGNVYLFIINTSMQLCLINKLNLNSGAIQCILSGISKTLTIKEMFESDDRTLLCTVGTNSGSFINVSAAGDSKKLMPLTCLQSFLGVNEVLLDKPDSGAKIKLAIGTPNELSLETVLETYYQNVAFCKRNLIRYTPILGVPSVKNGFHDEVPHCEMILDMRYLSRLVANLDDGLLNEIKGYEEVYVELCKDLKMQ